MRLRLIDLIFYLMAGALAGLGAAAVKTHGTVAGGADGSPRLLEPPPSLFLGSLGETSLLLVGVDDRETRGRADCIILAYFNPQARRIGLLSIPRDLKVPIPGRGSDKINHSYHFGGVPLLKGTLEDLLQERFDRYIRLDFRTFREVIDTLGGVTVTVKDVEGGGRGMNYDDNADGLHIHLKPGEQKLDGAGALGFVRYREDSDLKRSARQQELLQAVLDQHLHPTRLPALIRAARKILHNVDTDLSLAEGTRLALSLRRVGREGVMTATLPVRPLAARPVFYWALDDAEAPQVRAKLRDFVKAKATQRASLPLKGCAVAVLNGSGTPGAATRVGQGVTKAGARLTFTGNAKHFSQPRTEIRFHGNAREAAEELRRALKLSQADLVADDDFAAPGAANVQITVGRGER